MANRLFCGCCNDGETCQCFVEWLVKPAIYDPATEIEAAGATTLFVPAEGYGSTERLVVYDYELITIIEPIDNYPDSVERLRSIESRLETIEADVPAWTPNSIAAYLKTLTPDTGGLIDDAITLLESIHASHNTLRTTTIPNLVTKIGDTIDDINEEIFPATREKFLRVVPLTDLVDLNDEIASMETLVASLSTLLASANTKALVLLAATTTGEDDAAGAGSIGTLATGFDADLTSAIATAASISTGMNNSLDEAELITPTAIDWEGLEIDDDYCIVTGLETTMPAPYSTPPQNQNESPFDDVFDPGQDSQTHHFSTKVKHNDWPTESPVVAGREAFAKIHVRHTRKTRIVEDPDEVDYEENPIEWYTLTKGVSQNRFVELPEPIWVDNVASYSTHSYEDRPDPSPAPTNGAYPNIRVLLPDNGIQYRVSVCRSSCPDPPEHNCPLTHRRWKNAGFALTWSGYPALYDSIEETDITGEYRFFGECRDATCNWVDRRRETGMDAANGTRMGHLIEGTLIGYLDDIRALPKFDQLIEAPIDEHQVWSAVADLVYSVQSSILERRRSRRTRTIQGARPGCGFISQSQLYDNSSSTQTLPDPGVLNFATVPSSPTFNSDAKARVWSNVSQSVTDLTESDITIPKNQFVACVSDATKLPGTLTRTTTFSAWSTSNSSTNNNNGLCDPEVTVNYQSHNAQSLSGSISPSWEQDVAAPL